MNHTAARRFAVGSGITALASASIVAAAAAADGRVGWALAGWSVTAITGVVGGAWMTARLGRPDSGVVVAFGSTMLARLFASTAGALVASTAGEAAFWPFAGGLIAGFLPVQAYEIGWFYRLGKERELMLSPETTDALEQSAQHGAQAAEHAADAGHAAAQHGELGFDVGGEILHHILDSNEWHFYGLNIHFPKFPEVFGIDLSITKHVAMMWIAGIVVLLLARTAMRSRSLVPRGLRNALEVLVVFIRDEIARKSIPEHADRFVGYLLTTFFFIVTCNLIGLVPGMATATGNISVTAGLALVAFGVIQVGGIREFGPITHFKNLVPHGLPRWLVPLMFALEFLSMFIKPFALCIRLFANMMAGHVVILAFISLIFILAAVFSPAVGLAASPLAVGFALFVHLLELLVAFLQAYIFTMLTAQFIGMSVHPSH